jgi:hypothetical protein
MQLKIGNCKAFYNNSINTVGINRSVCSISHRLRSDYVFTHTNYENPNLRVIKCISTLK